MKFKRLNLMIHLPDWSIFGALRAHRQNATPQGRFEREREKAHHQVVDTIRSVMDDILQWLDGTPNAVIVI